MLFQGRFFRKEHGERVVMIVHHHWWMITRKALRTIFLAILPALVWTVDAWFEIGVLEALQEGFQRAIILLLLSIVYLYLLLLFFHDWLDYHLDVWIITDRRVIDVEQKGILSRVVSEHRLERIQDLSAETHGIAQHLLKYGDLHIQTAGEEQRFVFEAIPHPQDLVALLNRLIARTRPAPHP